MTPKINILKYLRTREGKTMAQLAEETGLTANDICRLENDNHNCGIQKALTLAVHFGVTVDALVKNDFAAIVRTLSAPPKTSHQLRDKYRSVNARRELVGEMGEQWALEQELEMLKGTGFENAVNQNYADDEGAHFDLLSFTKDGTPKICEVKATSLRGGSGFYMTAAELNMARLCRDDGILYEVHYITHALDPSKRACRIITSDELLEDYTFEPVVFKVKHKKAVAA